MGLVNILLNGNPREEPAELTVAQLLSRLELPSRGIAVELNQQIVPRSCHAEQKLQDGDRIEIVSFVGGG
ncbi:MAG: sulfur carrier protein ThiS [Planctomycetales bacterium]|nr:sulfur carrier protein ThiS [Planctomycetales bacterium]